MDEPQFEELIAQEWEHALPERFRALVHNVAFLVEDEPSAEVRTLEGLGPHETLLGHYHGIPTPMRGDWYGMGATLPDTITLYRLPICEEALEIQAEQQMPLEEALRRVVRETIWHEVAHHFGMDEGAVRKREGERDSI